MSRYFSSLLRRCVTLAAIQTVFSIGAIGILSTPGRAAPTGNAPFETAQPEPQKLAQSIMDEIRYLENSGQRWIEVDLSQQLLTAWSGSSLVYSTYISSGVDATPTPTGVFSIQTKYDSTPMSGADYYVPDVPYAMFFYGNYAIHGAYWHNDFGTPVSHGCINLPLKNAQWLFDWAEIGTTLIIHE